MTTVRLNMKAISFGEVSGASRLADRVTAWICMLSKARIVAPEHKVTRVPAHWLR